MRIVKLLLFLVSLLLVRVDVCAYDFEVNGLCYNILSDSNVELTWEDIDKPYTGDIIVPDCVDYSGKRYDVVAIGDYAFAQVAIISEGKDVGGWSSNDKLSSVLLSTTITSIGYRAFVDCGGLTSITIPNSVTTIEKNAFEYCKGLTSIRIPSSVTTIENNAFVECWGLTSINVASGNPRYDSRNDCNAIIETSTNTLISGCMNTTIPNSVTSIGNHAFDNCHGLTSITIPNSVISIGKLAFYNCLGLTSITIPNSVTSIGDEAFLLCSGLTSITIPNSVTSIGDDAFKHCSGLTSINVASGNPCYDSRNDCNAIIETSTNMLISGCMNTTIPNSVTSIGDHAFYVCIGLTSIKIPNSVTSIGDHAFDNCRGLTSITIPNSVISIGDNAFYGCSGLTSITIPNSVTSIGDYAFENCSGLTSIKSEITDPFTIAKNVFPSSSFTETFEATLTVPYGTKAKYQATEGWNKFANIVEEGTTDEVMFTIDGTTFQGSHSNKTAVVNSVDTKLKTLEIPASVSYNGTNYQVTGIADNAFSGCTMAALIWNADAALPSNAFSSASIGSNFLLYVNSASYAPSNVKNVVVDGIAQTILLSDDGGNFYCPEGFTAQSISYTHNYSMATGGNGKGWEALALPFDVKNIEHKTKGTLTPFALYDSSNSSQRPFWLYELGSNGFIRSSGIRANTPYIIAMPNNTSYDSDYILTGDVTFSASNAQVYETSSVVTATSGSKRFVPAFSAVEKSSDVYTLNVSNQKVLYSGSYDKGSLFISNLRSAYPFEAYMTTSSSATRTRSIGIEFDDDATAIDIVPATDGETDIVKVYSMNGILVLQTDHKSLQKQWESLPAGVYIVNGKKVLK